jgi:hypothetical protein
MIDLLRCDARDVGGPALHVDYTGGNRSIALTSPYEWPTISLPTHDAACRLAIRATVAVGATGLT